MKTSFRHLSTIVLLTVSLTSLSICSAQEVASQPNETPATEVRAFTFTGTSGKATVVAAPILTQPTFGSFTEVGGNGFTLNDNENYSFLNDPSVRKDLEFVDEQYKQFTDLQADYQKEMQAIMPEFAKTNGDPEAMQELQRKMSSIRIAQKEGMREILLPHQKERYQQVSRQMKMNMLGPGGAFQHGFLVKELDITPEQRKRLQQIQKDYQKELNKKTQELKSAAEKKVLDSFSTEQKEKLKELIGEKFKHDPNDWRTKSQETPKTNQSDND